MSYSDSSRGRLAALASKSSFFGSLATLVAAGALSAACSAVSPGDVPSGSPDDDSSASPDGGTGTTPGERPGVPGTSPSGPGTTPSDTDGGASTPGKGDPADCSVVKDACPSPKGGVTTQCKKRFMFGVNYAWSGSNFGQEFGGNTTWNVTGVAKHRAERIAELKDMRAHGVTTIRWWMYPEFRGEGVKFDAAGTPVGLGGTAVEDIQAALEIAKEADVHVMFCLFSFDNFRPSHTASNLLIRSIKPLIESSDGRTKLAQNVVRSIAKAVASSPNKDRLVAWDLMNEPEWALRGTDRFGDPAFDPNPVLETVTHEQLEAFFKEATQALRAESSAPVSVGAAALKWAKAWKGLNLDFYQFHTYEWVEQHYPFTKPLAEYGVADKPVVMGEFPMRGVASYDFRSMVEKLESLGYAGALGWAYNDKDFPWAPAKDAVKAANANDACTKRF